MSDSFTEEEFGNFYGEEFDLEADMNLPYMSLRDRLMRRLEVCKREEETLTELLATIDKTLGLEEVLTRFLDEGGY